MIPIFEVLFGGSDRTPALKPILESINIVDKPGLDADTADITLKASQMLAIPEGGTEVVVKLGYRERGVWEVFKGIANRVGFSGPPDRLFIQATGVGLSDDKRMQDTHTRTWNEPLTLGEVLTDIIQGAGFRARVHEDLSGIALKRKIQSIETDIEILSQLARSHGAIIKSDGETVAVVPRGNLERADGRQLDLLTLSRLQCSKYSWTLRQRDAYKTVVAFHQNEDDGATQAVIVGSGEPELRLKPIYETEASARGAAQQELDKVKLKSQINLTVPGQFVAVGSPLAVRDFPSVIDREYQVSEVRHSFGRGYATTLEAESE